MIGAAVRNRRVFAATAAARHRPAATAAPRSRGSRSRRKTAAVANRAPVVSGQGEAAKLSTGTEKAAPSHDRNAARRLAPARMARRNVKAMAIAPRRFMVATAPGRPATA